MRFVSDPSCGRASAGNDPTVLGWLEPRPRNLIGRLDKVPGAGRVMEELYLSVLSRPPSGEDMILGRKGLSSGLGVGQRALEQTSHRHD
jgi:hypothetical protein